MPFARRCDPGPEGVFSNPGMARRRFYNPRLAPGGSIMREHVSQGNDVRYWCHGQRCPSVTYDIMCGVGDNTLCVFHSVYTLIFHTPTDLPLHAGTEDLLLLVDVYYLVWLAGGKP